MATELAKAYVQIIPSAKGIKGMLQKELGGEASAAGESAGKSFGSGLAAGLAGFGKAAAAALGAATTAGGAFAKSSLNAYGEFEQLAGGVETLFKDSADIVMGYADSAYKTAGLSANQYMETVTSFSASLLQSLGGDTEAAAQYADTAITDMADNANKMGTAMDSIQNAYAGFAKQNFTMLDNLKLGYGGTKEEMQRLLEDAEKLSGIQYDISSYADIVDAIHVVQTELGISGITAEEAAAAVASGAMTQEEAFEAMGTTAKEAATTIQGSMAAAKASFQNLIVGIADGNADLDTLIGNFVDSVSTAGDNILPRIEQILVGIGQAVQKLAPILSEQLPPLISSVLPSLISAGSQLLTGLLTGIVSAMPELAAAIPGIISMIAVSLAEAWPALQAAGGQLLDMLTTGMTENFPALIEKGLELLLHFSSGLRESAGSLVDIGIDLLQRLMDGIVEALPALIETVPLIVSNIAGIINDNAPKLLETAASLIWELVTGLIDNIPVILENMPQIIAAIWDTIQAINWIDLGSTLIHGIANGITAMTAGLRESVKNLMQHPIDFITGLVADFRVMGGKLIKFLSSGISGMASAAFNAISNIASSITSKVFGLIDAAKGWGIDMIQGFVNGIASMISRVVDTVKGLADKVRSFLHFSRPDEGPLRDYETWMPDFMQGLARGIDANAWRVQNAIKGLAQDLALELFPSVQMPSLQAAAVTGPGAAPGGGTVTNFYQTIHTHDSLSESELTREAEDLLARGRWKNP